MIDLDEKWLMDAAGWKVVKHARQLYERGAVLRADVSGDVLNGVVESGGRPQACGLRIVSRTEVENLCQCPASRRTGGFCEHAAALVVATVRGLPERAEHGATAPQAATQNPPAPETDGPEEPPLAYFVPPQITRLLEKGSLPVTVARPAADGRFASVRPGEVALTPAVGGRVLRWFREAGLDAVPPVAMLRGDEVAGFLAAAAGHPRIFLGVPADAEPVAIAVSDVPFRPRVEIRWERVPGGESRPAVPPRVTLVAGRWPAEVTVFERLGWVFAAGGVGGGRAVLRPMAEVPAPLRAAGAPGGITCGLADLVPSLDVLENVFDLEDPDSILRRLEVVEAPPVVELGLEGSLKNLAARLGFRYGDVTVAAGASRTRPGGGTHDPVFPRPDPDNPLRFIVRNPRAESAAVRMLEDAGFKAPDPQGYQHLSGENAVLSFYGSVLPDLQRRWNVTLGDRFRTVTTGLERIVPVVRPRSEGTASGADWLEVAIDFETPSGVRVPRSEIDRILRVGKGRGGAIRLPDGSRAVVDLTAAEDIAESLRDAAATQPAAGRYKVGLDNAGFLAATAAAYGIKEEPAAVAAGTPPGFVLPESLENQLRPYQREGVEWLWRRAFSGGGAVLADEMGLGKTVQVIALMAAMEHRETGSGLFRALIVCPTSLLENWRLECARFAPHLSVAVLHGTGRDLARENFAAGKTAVAITSYGTLVRDLAQLGKLTLSCLTLDEASAIKNPDTETAKTVRQLDARMRVALTGTPVENALGDLWSIGAFVAPGYLGSRKEFHERYEKPLAVPAGAPREVAARLRRRLAPLVLRRLKRDVARDLPDRIEKTVWCELSDVQREVYRRLLEEGRESIRAARRQNRHQARLSMLTLLLRLRQTCCDLRLLGLEHIPEKEKGASGVSGKLVALDDLLNEIDEGGHRALIFSQFVSMLTIIREIISAAGWGYAYLDGGTPAAARAAQVRAFQDDPALRVFLISLKAGGYGLNLTGADTVIHFDPWWNPATEAQATDRAHRIGQRKVVTAYKLITRGTVEEKILQLQVRKQGIFDTALDEREPLMRGLSETDLEAVLEV